MKKSLENNVEILCSCPVQTTTIHHEHFLPYGIIKSPYRAKLKKPFDIELISGHMGNNLKMNKQQIVTKVWPEVLQESENYEDFLKRLEKTNKQVFNMYFKEPPVNGDIVEEIYKKFNKTTYQVVFSPDTFMPRSEKRRFAKLASQPVSTKYKETTYRTYFNHINEMQDEMKEILKGSCFKENKEQLRNDLKTVRQCTRTTYHDEIAVLGKLYAKSKIPGPIDRYTLRKV